MVCKGPVRPPCHPPFVCRAHLCVLVALILSTLAPLCVNGNLLAVLCRAHLHVDHVQWAASAAAGRGGATVFSPPRLWAPPQGEWDRRLPACLSWMRLALCLLKYTESSCFVIGLDLIRYPAFQQLHTPVPSWQKWVFQGQPDVFIPPAADRDCGQVPGPAERLHPAVPGAHARSGPPEGRAAAGGGHLACPPRAVCLRAPRAVCQLL